MSTLLVDKAGQLIYVDGPRIAYWSRRSMHKGKITMLGRIMAGSQAVIAHDDAGQAVFVAYYPYNDTCLDMLIFPAYAVSKNSDHLYEEAADVTGMPNARRGVLHPAI